MKNIRILFIFQKLKNTDYKKILFYFFIETISSPAKPLLIDILGVFIK